MLAFIESAARPISLTTSLAIIISILFLSILTKDIKENMLGRYHYFDYFFLAASLVLIILGFLSNELIINLPFCNPASLF
jgi:hypothetical protein